MERLRPSNVTANGRKRYEDSPTMDYQLAPPDGGWGWMVVFGSFVINILIFGLFRAGGIVIIECSKQFHNTHSVGAWIPVLNTGLAFFLAPVSGLLVRRYGYRHVVFIGGLICSTGLTVCHFATNITYVLAGYGVLLGCGLGLALNPNLTIVGLYFQKRRALATGISFSGGAVGVFIMGPLFQYLIEQYTFQGTFLILSAIFLHICVGATLFHPVQFHLILIPDNTHLRVTPLRQIPEITTEFPDEPEPYEKEPDSNGNVGTSLLNGYCISTSNLRPVPLASLDEEFEEGSIASAARHSFGVAHGPLVPKITVTTVEGSARSVTSTSDTSAERRGSLVPPNWRRDLGLLRSELLLLVAMAYGIALAAYVGVTVMLPDYVLNEIPGSASKMDGYWCVMVAAIGDLIGRLTIGWFVDKLKHKKQHLYHICISILGCSISLLPLIKSYSLLMIICFVIGLNYGICLVHSPCFLAEFFGVDKLSWTMGLMLTLAGFPVLSLGPIIGTIKERTGSYEASFWSLGFLLLVVAISWFFLPCFLRRHHKYCAHQRRSDV